MKSLRIVYRFVLCCQVLWLANCSAPHPPISDGMKYGGVLSLSALASLENLDPPKILFRTDLKVAALVYEGLMRISEEGTPEPALARKMEVFDKGSRYRFTIRDSVYFHDDPCFPGGRGRQLTGRDVLACFQRMAAASTQSPQAYLFSQKILGFDDYAQGKQPSISGLSLLDSMTVEFRLTQPYVSFPILMTTSTTYLYPIEAVTFYRHEWPKHPVGTGAFRLSRWNALESLSLVRHAGYWSRNEQGHSLPYLDGINITLVSDNALYQANFLKAELSVLELPEEGLDAFMAESPENSDFNVLTLPNYGVRMLGFALDKKTLAAGSVQVRRCIAQAFDRHRLIDARLDSSRLSQSLVPAFLLDSTESEWVAYAPQRARMNIQKYHPSAAPQMTVMSNFEAFEIDLLEQGLRYLGFAPRIQIQKGGYYRKIITGRPDLFRISFQPGYPDPEEYFALFYSKAGPETNLFAYANEEYDRCFEASQAEMDNGKRKALFRHLSAMLNRDVPALWLCHSPNKIVVTRSHLHDIQCRFNLIDYSEAWMDRHAVDG